MGQYYHVNTQQKTYSKVCSRRSNKMTEEQEQFLVAQDVYLKSGIHIGTKFRTKYMDQFIYKTRLMDCLF
jgi:ribosomal protein S2